MEANNNQEAHADIIALARRELEQHERINCWFRPEFVRALIDRLEAAHRREIEAMAAKCCRLGRLAGYGASEIKHQQELVGNGAKMRETDDRLSQLVSLINGEINHYVSQGIDYFSADCGSWHIQYDKTKGETDEQ